MTRKSWTKAAWLACGLGILSAPGGAENNAALKELKNLGGPETARAITLDAEPKTAPAAALFKVRVSVFAQRCDSANGSASSTSELVGEIWTVSASDFPNGQLRRTADNAKGTISVTVTVIGKNQGIIVAAHYASKVKNALGSGTADSRLVSYFGAEAQAGSGRCEVPSDVGTIVLSIWATPE